MENTRSLPDRRDYVGSFRWLMAVQKCIGQPFVFALDDAFMCMGLFLGYNVEPFVYGYGNKSIAEAFPQVILLGTKIDEKDVACNDRTGLQFTTVSRTIEDAIRHQDEINMQGTVEALSDYYFAHGETTDGIDVREEYVQDFERILEEAKEYYNY